jgi:hypothetical protein
MAPKFSEDEIDDLLYFARTGDREEFDNLSTELCRRESITVVELLQAARDEGSGNGVLHMAAANGHHGMCIFPYQLALWFTNCCIESHYNITGMTKNPRSPPPALQISLHTLATKPNYALHP